MRKKGKRQILHFRKEFMVTGKSCDKCFFCGQYHTHGAVNAGISARSHTSKHIPYIQINNEHLCSDTQPDADISTSTYSADTVTINHSHCIQQLHFLSALILECIFYTVSHFCLMLCHHHSKFGKKKLVNLLMRNESTKKTKWIFPKS